MPSEDENVKFLYLILTVAGTPSVDWAGVGKTLDLKPGAVSKRWSRLKSAMTDGKNPGPTTHQFLWLAIKYQIRDDGSKAPDWKVIADAIGIKPGAASKRFSRLKQSMAAGAAMPTATAPAATTATADDIDKGKGSKRKRGGGAKSAPVAAEPYPSDDEEGIDGQGDGGSGQVNEVEESPTKKKKTATLKAKTTPKPKATPKKEVVKEVVHVKNELKDEAGYAVDGIEDGDNGVEDARLNEWLDEV